MNPVPHASRHRDWIQSARRQVDAADASATAIPSAGRRAAAVRSVLPPDLFPGYVLERELHRGGQGVVYAAVQKSTGRKVALKVLREGVFADSLDRARFEREVQVLATLKHPNIVAIYDSGNADGRFYFVMDFIPGRPLDAYMSGRPRTVRETLRLFAAICEAVDAAHVRGIIHRDLKPANVRIDDSGTPYVLDFGLAKLVTPTSPTQAGGNEAAPATTTGRFIGSLPWAAPEQADGKPGRVDTRTDVYALGVLLYQMLTGKFPYPVVGNVRAVLDNIVNAAPLRPRSLRREIDDEVETLLLKCLSKERERRYQTAGELARDVRRYLAGEPIEAKRDSAWYVLRKTARRYRIPLAAGGLFLVLLLASTVVAWTLSVRAREAAHAARQSENNARLYLRDALIAEARATRRSGQMGQRFDALEALAKAAAIGPTFEARNEAIAAMALPDLRLVRRLAAPGTGYFDQDLKRCAVMATDGAVTVVRAADDVELGRIPAPVSGIKEMHWAALSGRFFLRIFDPPVGDRRLEVWDIAASRSHLEFTDVPQRARFDLSPDGARLAIGRLDQAIHIYDLESKAELQRVALDRQPSYLSFDPSGQRLALYHENYLSAQILDLKTGQGEPAFQSQAVAWSVAWHPAGEWLAAATGRQIELWDSRTQRTRGVLSGHEAQVVHVRFSHDGTLLLSFSWDGDTFLWDARSRRPLLRFSLAFPAFSVDDRWVVGTATEADGNRVKLFELDSALERRRLIGSGNADDRAEGQGVFVPSSALLVVAHSTGVPDSSGLRIFDVDRGREMAHQTAQYLWSLSADRRSRFLVVSQEDAVSRWPLRVDGGRMTLGPPQPLLTIRHGQVDLTADGQTAVAASDGEIALIDVSAAGEARRLASPRRCNHVRISPDGRWLAADGCRGPPAGVWDLQTAERGLGLRVLELPACYADGFAFSPDGRSLISSNLDGLSNWEAGTWRLLRRAEGRLGTLRFSPDGRYLAGSSASQTHVVQLLDANTLELLASLEPPESYPTWDLAFSSDRASLAQITSRDGVVHVWDLRAIRARLASLGLDWDSPPYPPAPPRDYSPQRIEIDVGEPALPPRPP